MPERFLWTWAKIDSRFEEMGCPGVAQRMTEGQFVDRSFEGFPEGTLHAALGHGRSGGGCVDSPTPRRRKNQQGIAMGYPVVAQEFQGPLGQGNVTVFPSFPVADMKEPASTVDIGDAQAGALLKSQPTGVNRGETGSVAEQLDVG